MALEIAQPISIHFIYSIQLFLNLYGEKIPKLGQLDGIT